MSIAFNGVATLSVEKRVEIKLLMEKALDGLRRCNNSDQSWSLAAGIMNLAEVLSEMGIGSDEDTVAIINAGHDALASIIERRRTTPSWALKSGEISAIREAFDRYALQLQVCSVTEHAKAMRTVENKMKALRSGSVPKGVTVVSAL